MTEAVLSVRGVHLTFDGVTALADVSLEVGAGELVGLIGPNGAGKTSLFNVVCGIYRPRRGEVRVRGVDVTAVPPHRIAALGVARSFQNIALFANLTVLDNLLLGRHSHVHYSLLDAALRLGRARRAEAANRESVRETADFLGLTEWLERRVSILPYGVQKRVEVGRALAMEPRLLLLDEPTAGTSAEETADVARLIRRIRDELGVPTVLASHDTDLILTLADRVVVLDFGRVIAAGAPDDVQRDPRVLRAYLGPVARPAEAAARGTVGRPAETAP